MSFSLGPLFFYLVNAHLICPINTLLSITLLQQYSKDFSIFSKTFLFKVGRIWLFICCKTNSKFFFLFLKKYLCLLQNIHYLQKKMFLYGKKMYIEIFFLLKKTFFTEKHISENVKISISFEKYIFILKMFVLQTKYKSFLKIYSFCKNFLFDHKKYVC